MTFDFKFMIRLFLKSLFATRGTNARLTPRRIIILLVLCPSFVLIELMTWLGFVFDEILFRGYRSLNVNRPVFIVGPPRSGTTFMHRLLAGDKDNFTAMKLWEIIFAPSITQKKFWLCIGRIDRMFGRPLERLVLYIERLWLHDLGKKHSSGLFKHEEDEFILIHIFATVFVGVVFPFAEDLIPLVYFDQELPPRRRARIMSFYSRCVKAHMYVFGSGKRYLSKNPSFSAKVESLNETFPDAQIICMVRSPLNVLPSVLSLLSHFYGAFMSPLDKYPQRAFTIDLIKHWYNHAVASTDALPVEHRKIVTYDRLVDNPGTCAQGLYQHFGLQISPQFQKLLDTETEKSRTYRSAHSYSVENTGLTKEQIILDYQDIFDRFGFEKYTN
ncbi:MAG: sulfotransferase [Deltaproteobacteria bacterium]|nr:sulfotransferase [Deltaproteobacteria bacterium]